MRNLKVIAGAVAAVLFQTGCCTLKQHTPPPTVFHCGSSKRISAPASVPNPLAGAIIVTYARPGLAEAHKTRWTLDGTSWHSAGPIPAVARGKQLVQFWAKTPGYVSPDPVSVELKPGCVVTILIDYARCEPEKEPSVHHAIVGRHTSTIMRMGKSKDGNPRTKDTGSPTVQPPVSNSAESGYGKVQVVYVPPAAYTSTIPANSHPAKWSIDSGPWRLFNSAAVEVYAGSHTVQYLALKAGDRILTSPPFVVGDQNLRQIKVKFTKP